MSMHVIYMSIRI